MGQEVTKNLYQLLSEDTDEWSLVEHFGAGTKYEAVCRVCYDGDDGMWSGQFIFKDDMFSPPDPDFPEIQFQYYTSSAGNGVLALTRARNQWLTMCGIFNKLSGIHG